MSLLCSKHWLSFDLCAWRRPRQTKMLDQANLGWCCEDCLSGSHKVLLSYLFTVCGRYSRLCVRTQVIVTELLYQVEVTHHPVCCCRLRAVGAGYSTLEQEESRLAYLSRAVSRLCSYNVKLSHTYSLRILSCALQCTVSIVRPSRMPPNCKTCTAES